MLRRYFIMLVVAGLCAVGSSLAARGGLLIEWVASSGFTPSSSDIVTGILNPSYNPSGSVLAQLIFTTAVGPSPAQVGPGSRSDYSSGTDVVLDFFEVTSPPRSQFADFTAPQYQNPAFLDGDVFVRVFGRSSATIDASTRYWDGPLISTLNKDLTALPPPTAQVIQANLNTLPGGIGDPLNRAVQLVPEPSSLGMIALGTLVLGWRRRRRD